MVEEENNIQMEKGNSCSGNDSAIKVSNPCHILNMEP
jgi:hypothetical protein